MLERVGQLKAELADVPSTMKLRVRVEHKQLLEVDHVLWIDGYCVIDCVLSRVLTQKEPHNGRKT